MSLYQYIVYHFGSFSFPFQAEKMRHAETLLALEEEREKVQMALTEVDVLRKQLEREKATFEKAYVDSMLPTVKFFLLLLF